MRLDWRWSGQVVVTQDGLPYVGETAANQYVATGFNGNGYTWGTLAGLLFHDAILKRMNPWSDLLSVSRKPLHRGAWGYLVENMDYPFYLIADSLLPLSRKGVADLKPGEADVFKIEGQRVACARSLDVELHAVSAVCSHLGCLVRWNKAEQTWDCPCHGSRFQPTGEVISGPAETPLESRTHVTQG